MTWFLVVALTWLTLSAVAALALGRAIRLADRRRPSTVTANGNFAVDLAAH